MKSGRMKRILLSVIAFLFVGCSIAGGTVLLSNTSISDSNRGRDSTSSENELTKNAPTNSDLWTNGHYATAFDNEGEAGIDGTTEEKAYEIRTAEQLALLAYRINTTSTNSTYKSLYYVQTADIDLSLHYWHAIGYSFSYTFSGCYDGGGFTISGLYTEAGLSSAYNYQGLFGCVRGQSETNMATIKNVGIIDSNIQGYRYCGAVVGDAHNTYIYNCYNASIVIGFGGYCIGGVAGSGDVYYCWNRGDVSSDTPIDYEFSSTLCTGGVVGLGDAYYCFNEGKVKAAGICNSWYNSELELYVKYLSNAGGVVGYGKAYNCYNKGYVEGEYCAGGVVGATSIIADEGKHVIYNCYNMGDVAATNTRYDPSATNGEAYAGGIVGCFSYSLQDISSCISNCLNIGNISAMRNGGIVGVAEGTSGRGCTLRNSFYLTENLNACGFSINNGSDWTYTVYREYDCGTCTVQNAKDINWYLDSAIWHEDYPWDFENVWTFVEGMNDGYPVLRGFSTKITYNSNSQPEEVVSESFSVGETIVLAEADLFEREGYSISSWNAVADGSGVSYAPGATYTGSSVTLYAQWEAKIIQVNLDENGGSGGTSTIYLKYDSGWYSSSSCTSSSKITSLPSTPTRTGYEFKGYSTEPDGSGTLAVSETGAINVSDTFYSTDGTRTWYAVWEARNPAYYDSEGGFWYVENGKLPQSKVSESLKATLEEQWDSLFYGDVYHMGVEELANSEFTGDGGMQSKVYNGEEYVKFNGEFYFVESIRWRLVYSSSQQEGYAVENTSVLATMTEIVFVGSYSSTKIGAGEGYSAESVTMLLKNQVSDDCLVSESREVEIFGAPKDTTTVSGSVFVASCEELANFTTSKNNTTGSGVKPGKASFSDFVKDYLRATGQGDYYFTRDLGDQLNNIRCLNPVGDRSQAKAQQTLGVQFTIKVTEYACVSA